MRIIDAKEFSLLVLVIGGTHMILSLLASIQTGIADFEKMDQQTNFTSQSNPDGYHVMVIGNEREAAIRTRTDQTETIAKTYHPGTVDIRHIKDAEAITKVKTGTYFQNSSALILNHSHNFEKVHQYFMVIFIPSMPPITKTRSENSLASIILIIHYLRIVGC